MEKKRSRIPGGSGKTLESAKKTASFRAERSHSLKDDVVYYTPAICVEGNKESYWLHCTQAGLFQCKVTDLVFKMKANGDVTYRTVPWKQRLVAQLGKRPAGPLFDLECPQRSVCQLRLPHCEIISPGGGKSLSVGHVMDEGIENIVPQRITETHVIIEVTEFSAYGILDDVNSPNAKRALMPLFYTPPIDNPKSTLRVLLLPGNVVLNEVINERKRINGEEIYIESPSCDLIPKQEYTLSTTPQDDTMITIQPSRTPFDVESYHNYNYAFSVSLRQRFEEVRLLLRDNITSACAWEFLVDFSAPELKRHQLEIPVQHPLKDTAEDILFSVRSSFIDRASLPVIDCVLDRLLEKRVLNDAEKEMAVGMQRREKASFVIDTVKGKGPDASSHMISLLCKMDPFLSKLLGLKPRKNTQKIY